MSGGMSYEPMLVCRDLGIPVERMWLRDTWGAWVPHYQAIVLAEGLSPIQERCVLAHELEHALAHDIAGCGSGPYAERGSVHGAFSALTARQEQQADRNAARKLISISDLAQLAQRAVDVCTVALQLRVTERMLRVRLEEMPGEGWPWPQATSRIAG